MKTKICFVLAAAILWVGIPIVKAAASKSAAATVNDKNREILEQIQG